MNASHRVGGKHSMIRVSHDLSTALLEAIQQHAETYHGGKMDLDRTLSAIGDVASGFLVEIRDPGERETYVFALIRGIRGTTRLKLEKNPVAQRRPAAALAIRPPASPARADKRGGRSGSGRPIHQEGS